MEANGTGLVIYPGLVKPQVKVLEDEVKVIGELALKRNVGPLTPLMVVVAPPPPPPVEFIVICPVVVEIVIFVPGIKRYGLYAPVLDENGI